MKCGPDDCPILAYSDLTPAEQKVERKRKAKIMTDQGFMPEQIAKQFNVHVATIYRDLDVSQDAKRQGVDSRGRKKGGGRPKDRKKEPGVKQAQRSINATPKQWEQFKIQAVAEGYESAAAKLGALIAEPEIARADLSMSAQQKLDAAIRQHQRKLDLVFEGRVQEEINQRLDHIILPVWRKKIADAKKIYDSRRAITNKETFNIIVRCLHTDTRKHVGDDVVNDAFVRFMGLEKYLLNEKDSPTKFTGLPTTAAEWDQRKQEATAMRRAKRGHSNVGRSV